MTFATEGVLCGACKALIVFKKNSETGKWIPMQRVKTIYLCSGGTEVRKDEFMSGKSGQEVWISHFETCSDPNRFSKKRSECQK